MILNSNKLIVSVITKLAPQLSPQWPPKDLLIKFGINIEGINPDKIKYINNKILDVFKSFKNRKSIIPIESIINEGLISLDIPFQF